MNGQPGTTTAVIPGRPEEKSARGVKVEAKLKQIVLDQVRFDGLPLSEVLLYLNDESRKRDPDKVGVNFLINPNARPVALTGRMDPATGLPLATATEPLDVGAVVIKFNQTLRNVAMRDLLDAIVTVADHPIEYSLEDYGVVFAAKPETLNGEPVSLARPEPPPRPAQALRNHVEFGPGLAQQWNPSPSQVEPPRTRHWSSAELAELKPQRFNVDFGPGEESPQLGPAAAGEPGDFWNAVCGHGQDHFTATELKFAGGDPSPIEIELINLGGSFGKPGSMGVKSPMFETLSYPTGNKGGDSTVILHHVPAGKYNVYIYGHGTDPLYYGDWTLSVGGREYGRKQTTHKDDARLNTKWVEGSQYVKFRNVKVGPGEEMDIFIRPGGWVTDPSGRSFADAVIYGLQLIPVK